MHHLGHQPTQVLDLAILVLRDAPSRRGARRCTPIFSPSSPMRSRSVMVLMIATIRRRSPAVGRARGEDAAALLVDRDLHAVDLQVVDRHRLAKRAVALDQGRDGLGRAAPRRARPWPARCVRTRSRSSLKRREMWCERSAVSISYGSLRRAEARGDWTLDSNLALLDDTGTTRRAGNTQVKVLPLPGSLSTSSAAAMMLQHMLHDRKTETRCRRRARPGRNRRGRIAR